LAPLAAQAADERAGWATAAAPAGYYDTFQRLIDGKWHKETSEAVVKAVDGWEGRGAQGPWQGRDNRPPERVPLRTKETPGQWRAWRAAAAAAQEAAAALQNVGCDARRRPDPPARPRLARGSRLAAGRRRAAFGAVDDRGERGAHRDHRVAKPEDQRARASWRFAARSSPTSPTSSPRRRSARSVSGLMRASTRRRSSAATLRPRRRRGRRSSPRASGTSTRPSSARPTCAW